PFLFKRFHKPLSVNFAISCVHKTIATSLFRLSTRALPQSHDIAFPRFLSLKLQPDVPAKAGQSPCRFLSGSQPAPSVDKAKRPLWARSWKQGRFLSAGSCRRTRNPRL